MRKTPKIEYSLIRSNRKTLALYVRDSGVEVRAPFHMTRKEIDSFVNGKQEWVERMITKNADLAEKKALFEVDYGSRVPYRGREYIVGGIPERKVFFDNAFCVPVYLNPDQVKRACVQIYRMLARRDLTAKVQDYATQMGVEPLGLKINGAKTRWGSCSAKKNLNFSWRLMMADDEVIDYVVVHELAHIKEMNHSPRFWSVVEGVLPDYKTRQSRLKKLQKKLNAEDWE